MAETILVAGKKGRRLDIVITQGDDWFYNFTLNKKDGTPWDLTEAVGVGTIRKTPASPVLANAVTNFYAPTLGKGTLAFLGADTAGIPADPIDEDQPDSLYLWSYRITLNNGRTRTLFDGEFRVRRKL